MATIADLLIKIGADSSGLSSELSKSKEAVQSAFSTNPITSFNNEIEKTAGRVTSVIGSFTQLAAVAAGGFGLTAVVSKAVEAGDAVYQLTQQYQMSAAEASQMNRILKLTGGDAETAAKAILRLDKSLSSSSTEGQRAQAALSAYGVSLTDANGRLLPLNDQLANLSKGYQEAVQNGEGQAFLLYTLGARGMALTKTLLQYNEAAENAAKIKGIGLNPDEMHQANQSIKVMQMQLGQLELAAGSAFSPLVEEILPELLPYLQDTAKWLAANKTAVADYASYVVKLAAAYEGLKVARAGVSAGAGLVSMLSTGASSTAAAALSRTQQKQIEDAVKAAERSYTKIRNEAIKTAQQQKLSAEETRTYIAARFAEIGTQAAKTAEEIRATMTAKFEQVNLVAQASTAGINSALARTGTVAAGVGATTKAAAMTAANGIDKTKTSVVALGTAHEKTGIHAAGAGTKMKNAISGLPGMISKVTAGLWALSGGWLGVAAAIATAAYWAYQYYNAKIADERANTWKDENGTVYTSHDGNIYKQVQDSGPVITDEFGRVMSGGLIEQKLTAGTEEYANAYSGLSQNKDSSVAKFEAERLEKAAEAARKKAEGDLLAGLGSIGGGSGSHSYSEKDLRDTITGWADEYLGDASLSACTTYVKAVMQQAGIDVSRLSDELWADGEGREGPSSWIAQAKAAGAWHSTDENGAGYAGKKGTIWIVNGGDHVVIDDGKGGYYAANQSTSTAPYHYAGRDVRTDFAGSIRGAIDPSVLAGMEGSASAKPAVDWGSRTDWQAIKSAAEEFRENPYIALAMAAVESGGGDIHAINMAPGGGMFQILNGVQDAMTASGQRGSVADLFPGWDTDMAQNARAAMGVLRRKRDLTGTDDIWANVKAYNGGGDPDYLEKVQKAYYQTYNDTGMTARLNRELQARKDLLQLMNQLKGTLDTDTGSTYAQQMDKLTQDLKAKADKIKEIRTSGVDTKEAETLLSQYKTAEIDKITKAWTERWEKLKQDLAKTNAEIYGDYDSLTEAEYTAAVSSLDTERAERLKAVAQKKNDWEAELQVQQWYVAQVAAAEQKKTEALRENYEKQMQFAVRTGNGGMVRALTGSDRMKESVDWEGRKKGLQVYAQLAKDAYISQTDLVAVTAESLTNGLSSLFTELGTNINSTGDLVKNFGNLLISTILKVAAQAAAARLVMGIFGGSLTGGSSSSSMFTGGGSSFLSSVVGGYTSSYTSSAHYSGFAIPHFANGGILTAPTLGLLAEDGKNEAVLPLSAQTYQSLGSSISRYVNTKSSGNSAPVINITNNTGSQVSVESTGYDSQAGTHIYNLVIDNLMRDKDGGLSAIRQKLGGR
ncbi:hypothetical protein [uncultured Megasphaera sp.]|jgi:hypothetical protein|uniref:hypothetical protein n=1 Tax=uncultured Megasphaera sp. TaxID=165188 RepID=UPI002056B7FB|nr:hypothetical protein [uncultured Megasphaera sp.]DAE81176.1 MAG TPA: tail tape measure [Caudoviricetes sp.]